MEIWDLQNMNKNYIIQGTGKYFICPKKKWTLSNENTHMTILHNVTKLQNHKDAGAYKIWHA